MLTIIQNDPGVPLGTYADYLLEEKVVYRTFHPYAGEALPPMAEVGAAIVLGGEMGVHDTDKHPFLSGVEGFIRGVVDREVPFLGICLGGQLLADVLGARVTSDSPYGEKGTLPVILTGAGEADPLFAGLDRQFVSFQWHNDSFEVPSGAVHLATSPACPNQAFRVGARAYGIQFHPEVNRQLVADWSSSPPPAALTNAFLAGFDGLASDYFSASRRLLVNFLRIARLV
ncbi:MAG: type 1 glutamine amidotransferase [Desulfobacteraceae bacterium]|nr:MAG: type 1 glutamine amidotransferase [Desulfobacteraceae bacterium]